MSEDRIAWTDEYTDRANASDGVSRFGAYIRQRAHLFADDLDSLSPAAFAATVWTIGCSPVMSPGYVRTRNDVWAVTCWCGEEPGILVAGVEVRLPWPPGIRGSDSSSGWVSWARSRSTWDDEAPLLIPPDERQHALLVTGHLRVPVAEELLPAPCPPGALDVMVAKRAVAVIAGQVNAQAGPVLMALQESAAAGARR